MKKILIPALILMLLLSVFVACGSGGENDMKDDITTLMDDMSSDVSEFDDMLTENGNITSDRNGTTEENLLEEIIPGDDTSDITDMSDITDNGTTDDTTDGTAVTE